MLINRFIGGRDKVELAQTISRIYKQHGWLPIVDLAREANSTERQAQSHAQTLLEASRYLEQQQLVPATAYALKLSSFAGNCAMLQDTIKHLPRKSMILLDAEDNTAHMSEQIGFNKIIQEQTHPRVFKTFQMYRTDSFASLRHELAEHGDNMGIKLVRGAYMHSDKQVIHKSKHCTDEAFDEAARYVLSEMRVRKKLQIMLATHNNVSIKKAEHYSKQIGVQDRVAYAQLLGMTDALSIDLAKNGNTVYKYIPFGPWMDTIPYLLRRLVESGMRMCPQQ